MICLKFTSAQKLTLEVSLENTSFRNRWDFWVYPSKQEPVPGNVLVTDKLDKNAEEVLENGGSVFCSLMAKLEKIMELRWQSDSQQFSGIPHGQIISHLIHLVYYAIQRIRLFNDFPTEYYSNWQWWDPVSHSQAMIIDGFPPDLSRLFSQLIPGSKTEGWHLPLNPNQRR